MKKVMIALGFALLVGCSAQAEINVEERMDEIMTVTVDYATGFATEEKLRKQTEQFNDILKGMDGELEEYAELQLKANNLRLEGVMEDKPELITESARLQAQAQQIYNEIQSENP